MNEATNSVTKSIMSLRDEIIRYYELDFYVDNLSTYDWADRQVGKILGDSEFESCCHLKVVSNSNSITTVFEVFSNFHAARILGLSESGRVVFFPEQQLSFGF
jgi:hypothetical protein